MREAVFRERQEKVAFFEGLVQIIAQLNNVKPEIFGKVVREYSETVFQETYDAEALRQKKAALAKARTRIRRKYAEDRRQIDRLEKLGQYYDKTMGPLPFEKKPEDAPLEPLRKSPPLR